MRVYDLHLVFNLYSTNSFTELQIPFEDSLYTSEMHKKLLDIGAFWNSILIKTSYSSDDRHIVFWLNNKSLSTFASFYLRLWIAAKIPYARVQCRPMN
jgi:hypothetical protein